MVEALGFHKLANIENAMGQESPGNMRRVTNGIYMSSCSSASLSSSGSSFSRSAHVFWTMAAPALGVASDGHSN